MRKLLLFWVLLLSSLTYSQKEINREWATQINPVFENLDKSKVPHGILLDYAMEFTNVTAYNGILTDSTYTDVNAFGNIFKTLFMGKVTTDTVFFPRMEKVADRWFTYRNDLNQNEEKPVLVLSGLYYQYSALDEKALSEGKIKVENNRYYDSYINNEWQNPYKELQTIAFSLPVKTINRKNFEVILPEELLLSNNRREVQKIEIDFSDRKGYRELVVGQKTSVDYSENGIYRWNIRTTLINDLQLFSGTLISLNEYDHPNQQNVFIPGPNTSNIFAKQGAILRIDYAPGHNGQINNNISFCKWLYFEFAESGSLIFILDSPRPSMKLNIVIIAFSFEVKKVFISEIIGVFLRCSMVLVFLFAH